ncbi:MAG: 2,3-bisphosphoglycerate-independent phosphoglycerate mutase [Myxococcota bacterium]|jgi:2,3-bisphosphoglycerate-independent phosphoglycerate mutase
MKLSSHSQFVSPPGPVCLVVLDGVGVGPPDAGNAWHLAKTPVLDGLATTGLYGTLAAHGTAVGMPSDGDMGNSEVGHNALGAGRVFDQGAKLVQNAVNSGALFDGEAWQWLLEPAQTGGTLHIIGLWSDGNVHSHIDHAYALLDRALEAGCSRIRIHPLLDGRDVGEASALDYIEPLERRLAELRAEGRDVRVASGGGRMVTTMDRYEADWSIVERGWNAHVHGEGRAFASASEAIRTYRGETEVIDQYMPAFVVAEDGRPVGRIEDGDAVVFFNFRGDRAIELTRAFEGGDGSDGFDGFDRRRVPKVRFAGMMQYDGDLALPAKFLVSPPEIERTMGEYLAEMGIRQLAISETQKFGHVTYFFNGNRSEPFDAGIERYVEIPSDTGDFAENPAMQAEEIVDRALAEIDFFKPAFVRLNIANGDMVGHTGQVAAATTAMEVVDHALGRLLAGVAERGGVTVVLADHGNCEEMFMKTKAGEFVRNAAGKITPKTSHTLNPVPCAVVNAGPHVVWAGVDNGGLANVAATCLNLMGYEAPDDYAPSLVAPTNR